MRPKCQIKTLLAEALGFCADWIKLLLYEKKSSGIRKLFMDFTASRASPGRGPSIVLIVLAEIVEFVSFSSTR